MVGSSNNFLGLEIKVESGFETVELELTGGEEPSGGVSHGGEGPGRLLLLAESRLLLLLRNLLLDGAGSGAGAGNSRLGLAETGKVTREQTTRVGLVEGIDEGVDALAAGTVRDQGKLLGEGVLRVELDGVLVELEVPVGGVVGVDEGVDVSLLLLGLLLDEGGLREALGLGLGLGSGATRSGTAGSGTARFRDGALGGREGNPPPSSQHRGQQQRERPLGRWRGCESRPGS